VCSNVSKVLWIPRNFVKVNENLTPKFPEPFDAGILSSTEKLEGCLEL
jgi:hypothetical protein